VFIKFLCQNKLGGFYIFSPISSQSI